LYQQWINNKEVTGQFEKLKLTADEATNSLKALAIETVLY
jgi:hypothetical protein